ncbi:iron-sulfur cluster biosynthesis family protein [Bacillus testis]|uniref:iron-sulfur cluster biosynthesis family protein n=1 Tax=Bacillus testis TaxID=1622072 RepID=UPI00067EE94D|nr:iron-sulfur cluster biosynthesis family protein [Bacillus testis]
MNITWDAQALKQAKKLTAGKPGFFKLIYDNEDCGCSDGITTLWYIAEPEGNEGTIESNLGPILADRDQMAYLEEEMQITWVEDYSRFRLKTADGIINPFMKFYNWVK